MSMVNIKRTQGSPRNTIIPLGPSRPCGPTPSAPYAADEGGGGAELDEGGRDLERERDVGEGAVVHVSSPYDVSATSFPSSWP